VKGLVRGLGFFAISILVGELVRRVLMSRAGRSATERLGRPELATYEGASAASKEAKKAIGFVRALTSPKPPAAVEARPDRPAGWVGIARDAAEMLLAAGAVLKTASDFAQEDAKLRRRIGQARGGTQ
jgi:hypothetical protein